MDPLVGVALLVGLVIAAAVIGLATAIAVIYIIPHRDM